MAPPRIAYLVHDLSDPAVARRVRMLRAGGAEVVLLGFRRTVAPVASVAGVEPVDLGRTEDARMVARVGSVLAALARAPGWSRRLAGCDAVVARNLEMLALARAALTLAAPKARLAYEVLDVHRLMLGAGAPSGALRRLERRLMRRASTLVVSSPAFLSEYFQAHGIVTPPALLVENKVLALDDAALAAGPSPATRPHGPPWRIAWYGMIRCRRSLDLLSALAAREPGLIEVEIRGRPSPAVFEDFEAQVAAAPGVTYLGPYDPADLPAHYAGVHFVWAIDYYEAGLNSAWLLPNRLYEGQLHGAVAIALREVETGRWLARHGTGVLLVDAERDLGPTLSAMSNVAYIELARRTAALPRGELACDRAACAELVQALIAPSAAAPAEARAA